MKEPTSPENFLDPDRMRVLSITHKDQPMLGRLVYAVKDEFVDFPWDSPAHIFAVHEVPHGWVMSTFCEPIPLEIHPATAIKYMLAMKGPMPPEVYAVVMVSEIWSYSQEAQDKLNAAVDAKAKELGIDKKDIAGMDEVLIPSAQEVIGFPPSGDPHRIESRIFLAFDRKGNAAQIMADRGSKTEPELLWVPAPSDQSLSGRVPDALRSLLSL